MKRPSMIITAVGVLVIPLTFSRSTDEQAIIRLIVTALVCGPVQVVAWSHHASVLRGRVVSG